MRVLITGVSGTGKSSLVQELRRRRYLAFDADDDGFTEPLPDGTGAWCWQVEAIRTLFDQHAGQLLFFAGCSDEQAGFDFDFKVLLTAPVDVLLQRLATRTTNPFGKTRAQRDRILADIDWVLPLLRASADLTVDTTRPLGAVADAVIEAVEGVARHGRPDERP